LPAGGPDTAGAAGAAAGVGVGAAAAAGAAGAAAGAAGAAAASAVKLANALMSAPSSASTHTGVPTAMPCAPSPTRIFASTPSSTHSHSMVALSVSTSQRMSPAAITSPSFFFHAEMLPSVIVGLSAGMASTWWDGRDANERTLPASTDADKAAAGVDVVAARAYEPRAAVWRRSLDAAVASRYDDMTSSLANKWTDGANGGRGRLYPMVAAYRRK